MKVFETLGDVVQSKGQEIGPSEWVTVTQEMINAFATTTGDEQWIHVDPERAAKGPFGRTIAHGFLTVSLIPRFISTLFEIKQKSTGVNYGLNKVRFMAPILSGSRVRAHGTLAEATEVSGGMQFLWQLRVEIEGQDKPACVAEWLIRRFPVKD
ncbi:MaoC family dehydratase [Pseudorhodoferax soli]|uniref:Acyl dehydratase n=1 Tax=Pseudorhodoferax soli TaxID=545864 RepID=A0A368XKZ2_9BURK|nr:MaoC family dehydratase [Pseudorhodoferax soli]RCW68642.1 acyl dehydratase [Pseudorhodoferax soli]